MLFAGLIAATALTVMPVDKPEPIHAPVTASISDMAKNINAAVAAIDVQKHQDSQSSRTIDVAVVELPQHAQQQTQ
ncbi:hypothetical protein [Gallaecimonas mangrovi]|uniref:hypothetical protein n=1 Tax=Gallaecimonas mangrovi TaxID=2291597 RepID=UPI000E207816|nr:hypothetical protein [Gallaecimonas mangrovi]